MNHMLKGSRVLPGESVADEATSQAGQSLSKSKDEIIAACLNDVLGESEWKLINLKDRCQWIKRPGADSPSTFYLDGKPLVTFYPPRISMEHGKEGTKVRFTQEYQNHRA